LTENEPLQLAF